MAATTTFNVRDDVTNMVDISQISYPSLKIAPRGDTVDEYVSGIDNKTIVKVNDPYRFLEDLDSNATK